VQKPVSSHLLVAAGLSSQPRDARSLSSVPQIAPLDYPHPLSTDDVLVHPVSSMLGQASASAGLRIIQTAFDPELEANKKTEYRKMDKRDRFYYTQKERGLAEKASTPTSLDELEVEVSLFFYFSVLSLILYP